MTPIATDIKVINVPESGWSSAVSLVDAFLTQRG
jgi:hypothetical protein